MLPYIIIFIIVFCLAYVADVCFEEKKNASIVCLVLIGLVFTVFVGLRDFGVGYDTNVYIEPYFQQAENIKNIKDFFSLENVDRGFLLLAYIAHSFSSEPQSLLVVVELFIISFTLLGLYNYRIVYKFRLTTYFILYWLILFFYSENFMRQYCAMALLFYGFSLYIKEKKKVYVILQIVAFFFHSSSLLFVIIPIYHYLSGMKGQKRFYYSFIALLMLLVIAFSYYYVLALIGSYGFLDEAYADRYSEFGEGSHNLGVQIGITNIILITSQFFLFYRYKNFDGDSSKIKYISTILLITILIIEQMNAYNVNLGRMALYFSQIYCIYLSVVFGAHTSLRIIKIFLIVIMLKNCMVSSFDHTNESKDYTYSSKILNI